MKWISIAGLAIVLGFGWTASQAMAQQGTTAQAFDELSARLEQQDRQIQQLQAQVSGMQQGVNATPVSYAPGGGTAATSRAGGAAMRRSRQRHERQSQVLQRCGPDVRDAQQGLHHARGLLGAMGQCVVEPVPGHERRYRDECDRPRRSPRAASATCRTATTGAAFVLSSKAHFWETFEYRLNLRPGKQPVQHGLGSMNSGSATASFPWSAPSASGTSKTAMGLEGDMASSSRCMTFMERSSYSQAIEKDQNFVNGIWLGNTCFDDRVVRVGCRVSSR